VAETIVLNNTWNRTLKWITRQIRCDVKRILTP